MTKIVFSNMASLRHIGF